MSSCCIVPTRTRLSKLRPQQRSATSKRRGNPLSWACWCLRSSQVWRMTVGLMLTTAGSMMLDDEGQEQARGIIAFMRSTVSYGYETEEALRILDNVSNETTGAHLGALCTTTSGCGGSAVA